MAPSRDEAIDELRRRARRRSRSGRSGPMPASSPAPPPMPDFRAGDVDTGFIPAQARRLVPDPAPSEAVWNLAATALLASDFGDAERRGDPWTALHGFRAQRAGDRGAVASTPCRRRPARSRPAATTPLEGVAHAPSGEHGRWSSRRARPSPSRLPGAGGARRGGGAATARSSRRCRASHRGRGAAGRHGDQGPEAAHARGDEDGA